VTAWPAGYAIQEREVTPDSESFEALALDGERANAILREKGYPV
jgi:hypothetical protein